MVVASDTPGFTLYYRENCHLCESMRLALLKLQKQLDFNWTEIDIDRDQSLIYRFDTLVPALYFNEQEVCHHFLDEEALRALVSA